MKNKELIKVLKGFNPEADVSLTTCEEITVSYICKDGATKETTKQIFIEEENTPANHVSSTMVVDTVMSIINPSEMLKNVIHI